MQTVVTTSQTRFHAENTVKKRNAIGVFFIQSPIHNYLVNSPKFNNIYCIVK